MGYDMYLVEEIPGEKDRVDAARRDFHKAADYRDSLPKSEHGTMNVERMRALPDPLDDNSAYDGRSERYSEAVSAVHEAYEKMNKEHKSYFRLNIWGMGVAREFMAMCGMLAVTSEEKVPWPEPGDFDTTWEQVDEYDEEKLMVPESVQKFREARDVKLRAHSSDGPGIPDHKLGSNDGWVVTPEEIDQALEAYEKVPGHLKEELVADREWWPEWIDYLKLARDHGGFRVY